jgi:hypothetical protein
VLVSGSQRDRFCLLCIPHSLRSLSVSEESATRVSFLNLCNKRVQTVVYTTQNHWIPGLEHRLEFCMSGKCNVSESARVSFFRQGEEDIHMVGSLERAWSSG